jgi:hypothetical protein
MGSAFARWCMKTWKRRTLSALGVLGSLALAGYLSRDFWERQVRAYAIGRLVISAEDYGANLPEVDTVEVYVLSDEANADQSQKFLGDFNSVIGTLGHKTLTGSEAEEVAFLWRHLRFGRQYVAMCFSPVYGLQFKYGGQIIFQTSVCWHCQGYTLPVEPFGTVQNGFDAGSPLAQDLLKFLEKHLPLPKPPPEQKESAESAKGQ